MLEPAAWAPRQHLVVNNSRFSVLPDRGRYPNLASRVLGLCLRRLCRDGQARWGYPVLLVESFVEESRYRDSCHRACGFKAVGQRIGRILRRVQGTVALEVGGCGGRGR